MSDSAGEGPRVRRYPELPVWVVEDHQEVSARGGAWPWEAWQNRNVFTCAGCIAVGRTPGLPRKSRRWRLRGNLVGRGQLI